ncbi:MAG: hypothetical protein AB7U82_27580 [Blastocatellales bacterium]
MIVYTANATGRMTMELSERFPDRLGLLFGPGSQKTPRGRKYAIENGRFVAWKNNAEWSERNYLKLLEWATKQAARPEWILVPDVVADRDATLREWERWAPRLQQYGTPLAFAAQDGMTRRDVPKEASAVFIGGTTEWKWSHLDGWGKKRVHVGRVNSCAKLIECEDAGAESTDGTGWFRGDHYQTMGLIQYLVKDLVIEDRLDEFMRASLYCLDNLVRWSGKRRAQQARKLAPLFDVLN